jgi:hypothetical protein
MSKHTPGPWKLEHDELHYGSLSIVVAGEKSNKFPGYQMLVNVGGFAGVDEQEANASLIASAPELLGALKEIVELADFAMRYANRDGAEYDVENCLKEARRVIAKAEAL